MLGIGALRVGGGTEQDLHGCAAHQIPVGLVAGYAGNVLATSAHDTHVFRNAHAAPAQFGNRKARQGVVKAVYGRRSRSKSEKPVNHSAGAGLCHLGKNLSIPPMSQARVPQPLSVAERPPPVHVGPIPVRVGNPPVTELGQVHDRLPGAVDAVVTNRMDARHIRVFVEQDQRQTRGGQVSQHLLFMVRCANQTSQTPAIRKVLRGLAPMSVRRVLHHQLEASLTGFRQRSLQHESADCAVGHLFLPVGAHKIGLEVAEKLCFDGLDLARYPRGGV